ncbi:MAG: hypothetical protein WKH64_01770 [Chloroflexia bacterium]
MAGADRTPAEALIARVGGTCMSRRPTTVESRPLRRISQPPLSQPRRLHIPILPVVFSTHSATFRLYHAPTFSGGAGIALLGFVCRSD